MRQPYIDPNVVGFAACIAATRLIYGEDFSLIQLSLILACWTISDAIHAWWHNRSVQIIDIPGGRISIRGATPEEAAAMAERIAAARKRGDL